eukprot:GILK01007737.1.p1 GENE.GILK01007737.1~~GILK01007737.1.p1  ORF type:complete len:608 (-),score=136.81 GILK01007737.1:474-2297(-)
MEYALGTWTMLTSGARIVAGATTLGKAIGSMLPNTAKALDRQRLESLQRRVDCLLQPLNYCVLWARDKDSCAQSVIGSTRQLLQQVCDFVHQNANKNLKERADEDFSAQLDHFLQELHFSCISMNMVLHMIQVNSHPPSVHAISPAALLRASHRLQEMCGKGGDVTLSTGSLYRFKKSANDPSGGQWICEIPSAMFKVYFKFTSRQYELHVENAAAVGNRDPLMGADSEDETDDRLIFDLDYSLQMQCTTAFELNLFGKQAQFEADSSEQELDGHVITWISKPRADSTHLSSSVSSQSSHHNRTTPADTRRRYAFLFNVWENGSGRGDRFSSLDVYYLSRLCLYDNMHPLQSSREVLPHTLASDEELWNLFGDVPQWSTPGPTQVESLDGFGSSMNLNQSRPVNSTTTTNHVPSSPPLSSSASSVSSMRRQSHTLVSTQPVETVPLSATAHVPSSTGFDATVIMSHNMTVSPAATVAHKPPSSNPIPVQISRSKKQDHDSIHREYAMLSTSPSISSIPSSLSSSPASYSSSPFIHSSTSLAAASAQGLSQPVRTPAVKDQPPTVSTLPVIEKEEVKAPSKKKKKKKGANRLIDEEDGEPGSDMKISG